MRPPIGSSRPPHRPLPVVVSGGQTGVDRAALDAALSEGLATDGWCPRGRRAEDGRIAKHYSLRETPLARVVQRVELTLDNEDRYPMEATYRNLADFRELSLVRE